MKSNDKNALIGAIVSSGLDDLNMMFLAYTLSSIIVELQLSGAQAGAIGTVTNLGMLLGGVIFGVLADRYPKFTILKITVVIYAAATGLIFFANNIWMLYLLRFISGIGIGGEYGVAISVMAGIVPPEKMGRMSSLNGIVGQIGSISSAAVAGAFVGMLGWRGLFLIGFLPLIFVAWMHFSVKTDEITDNGSETADLTQQGSVKLLFSDTRRTHQTLGLMLMTTVQIAGYFGMMNWLPTMIQQQLNITSGSSATWMITTIIGMSIGMLVFGNLVDKIGPRFAYGSFLIASAVAVYVYSMATTPITILIGGAIVGFFVNGMFVGYGAVITRLYPYEIRTVANNTILNVGRAVGGFSSIIIGMILERSNVTMVMIFLASLYLISLVVMTTIPGLSKKEYALEEEIETNPEVVLEV